MLQYSLYGTECTRLSLVRDFSAMSIGLGLMLCIVKKVYCNETLEVYEDV